ncbi:MAG TPA: BON domain-containing protein [Verrucomicrobiae bacterium]|nr:BON domain-containing protein [Verrucomicrobiae bacterium]
MRLVFGSIIVAAIVALCGGCITVETTQSVQADAQPAPPAQTTKASAHVAPAAQAPALIPTPSAAAPPPSDQPTDESIGMEIRRRLNADPSTAVGIVAEVEDGKVTLRGTAPTLAVSWRAEAAAHSIKGVTSVVNQIIVNTPSPAP